VTLMDIRSVNTQKDVLAANRRCHTHVRAVHMHIRDCHVNFKRFTDVTTTTTGGLFSVGVYPSKLQTTW
jgi:DNA anti-recombination protein RmuC